jgi:hypothetical protein
MVQTTRKANIMLRTSLLWKMLAIGLFAHASTTLAQNAATTAADPASAQTAAQTAPPPPAQTAAQTATPTAAKPAEAAPRPDPVIEQGRRARPSVNATPKSSRGTKITEKKVGGRVTEVQVQSGPSSYSMRPNTPAGNAQVGDVQSGNGVRPPQWTLFEFGPGKKKTAEGADQTVDAPPPETVPAGK